MKKSVRIFAVSLLVLATLLSAIGCRDDGDEKKYTESGLVYYLPRTMEEMNVNYADVCYGDGEAEFFVYFYTSDQLLAELYMDKDSTVKEYATWFANVNGYKNITEEYDEAGAKITMRYLYEDENDFYFDYILRNENMLYHVTMTCSAEKREIYEPIFEEWRSNIRID